MLPQPTEAHARLGQLAGSWIGEEILYPSAFLPDGGQATGRFEIRLDLGGFFLISDYAEQIGQRPIYQGHGVYGYDTERARYTMQWFDAMGGRYDAPALGTFEGAVLCFENVTPRGHARFTYTLLDADRFHFRIDNAPDGLRWQPFMEGTYHRRPPSQ